MHWNAVAGAISAAIVSRMHTGWRARLNVMPTYPPGLRMKLSTCGLLGRLDETRDCVQRLHRCAAGQLYIWLSRFFRAPLHRNERALEVYIEGARRAGLPEW